jgi:hypothetical protein
MTINKPILEQIVTFHRTELRRFEEIQKDVSCHSCVEYAPGDGQCKKFNAEPPAEVKSVGCAEWVHDPIPF